MATTLKMDTFLASFHAGTVDLAEYFLGREVAVDRDFEKYVRSTTGSGFKLKSCLACRLSGIIREPRMLGTLGSYLIDGSEICAILAHLGGEGISLLNIPKGHAELNIVLGHAEVDGKDLVFYVEREVEEGVDRIHLHAEPPEHMEDGLKRVVYI